MDSSLVQEGYSDFILKPVAQSVWITVGDVSVYVRRQQGCRGSHDRWMPSEWRSSWLAVPRVGSPGKEDCIADWRTIE